MLLVGNPENRRLAMFQNALTMLGLPPATVVSYLDLLQRQTNLCAYVTPGMVARLESPGENFEVERELLRLGFADAEAEGCARVDPATLDTMLYDHGRILYLRQWYLGLSRFLRSLRDLPCRFMNAPDDILCMFDKTETHRRCQAAIPVPPSLKPVQNFDELIAAMITAGWNRVFIKSAHGSSASGVGALHKLNDGTMRLVTTTEMVRDTEHLKLYNSLKIRTYTDFHEIARLIDEWCRHRVHVEKWLPKAAQDGYPYDLRIVVIGGEPAHAVVRLGFRGTITNLHLGNRRGDFEQLAEKMGTERLHEIHETCRKVSRLFPDSHVIGVDLLLTPRFREHYVLELNAFGDLLPGLLFRGYDTYGYEIVKWFGSD